MGVDVQRFETSGTWVKPANCQMVKVYVGGPGGGGGSGSFCNPGVSATGGSGGGGGGRSIKYFYGALLPATVPVTVGTGGAGGVEVAWAGAPINGNAGDAGSGPSSFGDLLIATEGGAGGAGRYNTAGDTPGPGGNGNYATGITGGRGDYQLNATIHSGNNQPTWLAANYGGGGARGQTTAANAGNAGGSGYNVTKPLGAFYNPPQSGVGVDGFTYGGLAAVGGSGAAYGFTGSNMWKGGDGAIGGSGGGGGGGAYGGAGLISGPGGVGGDGLVVVVSHIGD